MKEELTHPLHLSEHIKVHLFLPQLGHVRIINALYQASSLAVRMTLNQLDTILRVKASSSASPIPLRPSKSLSKFEKG